MPIYSLRAPNGKTYEFEGPAGLSREKAIAFISRQWPESNQPAPEPKKGMGAALAKGFEQFIGGQRTGAQAFTGSPEEAATQALADQKALSEKYAQQTGLDLVKEAYDQKGVFGALGEVGRQVPLFAAEQAPQLGATLGGAYAGAKLGARAGLPGLIGGAVGGAAMGFLPNVSNNLAAQQEVSPGNVNVGKASLAAGAQSALDAASLGAVAGRRVLSSVLGKDIERVFAQRGAAAAEALAKERLLKSLAKGAAVGAGTEGTTEVMQDMIERAQAGKALLDDDALKSYAENFYGGALLGGPMGGAGRAFDASGTRAELADAERKKQIDARIAQAAEQEQQAAAEQEAQRQRMASPEYLQDLQARYAAYEQQKKDLAEQRKQAAAEKTDAGAALAKDLSRQLAEITRENRPLVEEYNAARPAMKAMATTQIPGSTQGEQGALFDKADVGREPEQVQAAEDPVAALADIDAQLERGRTALVSAMQQGNLQLAKRLQSGIQALETERAKTESLVTVPPVEPTVDPVKLKRELDKINAQLQELSDPSEFSKFQKLAKRRASIEEQLGRPQAPTQPETLFQAADREYAQEMGDATQDLQQRPSQPAQPDLFGEQMQELDAQREQGNQEQRAAASDQRVDEAFNRTFASKQRNPIEQTLMAGQLALRGEQALPDGERRGIGAEIAGRLRQLERMDREQWGDTAKTLQAQAAEIKRQLIAAREASAQETRGRSGATRVNYGNRAADAAVRRIAELEQQTKGRAHHTAEFYDVIAAALGRDAVEPFLETMGVPRGGSAVLNEQTQREQAPLLYGLRKRIGQVDDPRLTNAMEAVDDEAPPQLPAGLVDEDGQTRLFPAPGRGPVEAPLQDQVLMRIRRALNNERLTPETRALLERMQDKADLPDPRPMAERLQNPKAGPKPPEGLLRQMMETLDQIEQGRGQGPAPRIRMPGAPERVAGTAAATVTDTAAKGETPAQRTRNLKASKPETGKELADAETVAASRFATVQRTEERTPDRPIITTKKGTRPVETDVQATMDAGESDLTPYDQRDLFSDAALPATVSTAPNATMDSFKRMVRAKAAALRDRRSLGPRLEMALHWRQQLVKALQVERDVIAFRKQAKVKLENARIKAAALSDIDIKAARDRITDEQMRITRLYEDAVAALPALEAAEQVALADAEQRADAEAEGMVFRGNKDKPLKRAMDAQRKAEAKRHEIRMLKEAVETNNALLATLREASPANLERVDLDWLTADGTQKEVKRLQGEIKAVDEDIKKLRERIQKLPAENAPRVVQPPKGKLPTKPTRVQEEPGVAEKREAERVRGQTAEDYVRRNAMDTTKVRALTGQERAERSATQLLNDALVDLPEAGAAREAGMDQAAVDRVVARATAVPTLRAARERLTQIENELDRARRATDRERKARDNQGTFENDAEARGVAEKQAVLDKLEAQFKQERSAEKRAEILRRINATEDALKLAKERAKQRTLVAGGAQRVAGDTTIRKGFGNATRAAAEAELERALIEERMRAAGLTDADIIREGYAPDEVQQAWRRQMNPAAQFDADVEARKRQQRVEPGQRIDAEGELLENMQAKRREKPMPTRYSSKGAGVDVKTGASEVKPSARENAQQAKQAAQDAAPINDWEGEGGRYARAQAGKYAARQDTMLSPAAIHEALASRLDNVLSELATNGSTPAVRELATKLRPLVQNTRLLVEEDPIMHPTEGRVAAEYRAASDMVAMDINALTEEDLLHELVHAATIRALDADPRTLTQDQRNARAELDRLFAAAQKNPAFADQYGKVNIAEFAAEVMSNPDARKAIDALPQGWWARFKEALLRLIGYRQPPSKDAMAAVERLFMPSKAVARPAMPSAVRGDAASRFAQAITASEGPKLMKDPNMALGLEMALVDQRAPILKALSKGDQNNYLQAQYFLRKNDARMPQTYAVLTHGPAQLKQDSAGRYVVETGNGPSALDIFKAVGDIPGATEQEKFDKAQAFMVAQRAANKGWSKLGFEAGPELKAMADEMMAEVNASPELKTALERVRKLYNAYNKGMLQFLVDSGVMTKDAAAALLKDGDYVPFYRVGGNGVAELVLGDAKPIIVGDVRNQPYLAALKGDSAKLMPLNEAIPRNTMLLTDMGLRNLTTKSVAYALQDMGSDSPKGTNKIMKGTPPAGADIIKFRQQPDPKDSRDTGERWMRVSSEGTAFESIPSEMLVKSLEGVHTTLPAFLRILGSFGDLLRKGITRNPVYVLRQLTRDPTAAAFTAGIDRGPVMAALKAFSEFGKQMRGTSTLADELERRGVVQSGVFTGDPDDIKQFALQLSRGDQGAFTKLLAMTDRMAMRADAATRVQVYEDVLKKTGSEMQAELAAMEMMNFSKRGSSPLVQWGSRMVPFLNAQIQGLNVLVKAARGNASQEEQLQIRQKFLKAAVGLSAMSFLYALAMSDDETYQNAGAQERYGNFFVPLPGGDALRIPIPYEVGFLFKALPEAMVRGMKDDFSETDLQALKTMLFNSIPGGSSYFMPQAVKPLIEVGLNRSIFTGRDIEPTYMSQLERDQRFADNTTEIAKGVSSLLNALPLPDEMQPSPIKIDYLVRGYLGTLPIAAMQLANEVLAPPSAGERPDKRLAQQPLIGSMFQDRMGRGPVELAYAKMQAIETAAATFEKLLKDGKLAAAQKYKDDNINLLQSEHLAERFKREMADLRSKREQIMRAPIDAGRKKLMLDQLDDRRVQLGRLFAEAAARVVPAQ